MPKALCSKNYDRQINGNSLNKQMHKHIKTQTQHSLSYLQTNKKTEQNEKQVNRNQSNLQYFLK